MIPPGRPGSDDGGRAGGRTRPGLRTRRAARGEDSGTSSRSPRTSSRRSARPPTMSCLPWKRPRPGGGARASPVPRGCSPASRPARRPGSARGCRWTCCPAARRWRSPLTPPPGEDGRFAGVSEAELVGVLCAWDRVEAHAAARKLAVSAELARRNPAPRTPSSPPTRSRTRWASPAAGLRT